MEISIVPIYAGILALIYTFLTISTIRARRKHKVAIGNGGNEFVIRATRVHGNFIEYAPIILFLFLLLELQGFSKVMIHAAGILLVISRLLHAFGVSKTKENFKFRISGMMTTMFLLVVAGCLNIYMSLTH